MKEFFKSLFGISGKEINGFLVLIILLILVILYPKIYKMFGAKIDGHSLDDRRMLDSLVSILQQPKGIKPNETFLFNPNNTCEDSLLLLGFSPKAARQIVNYRGKGGVFRVKTDLYRIYNADSFHIQSIYQYIDLPIELKKVSTSKLIENNAVDRLVKAQDNQRDAEPVMPKFNINQADTAMLQTINGIGSVLSNRIIAFRDKLGGFVDMKQLHEVYNLDSAALLKLTTISYIDNEFVPVKIMINIISEEEIRNHPYISRSQARLLIAYRNQHGYYNSLDELAKVYSFNTTTISRLKPYISLSTSN